MLQVHNAFYSYVSPTPTNTEARTVAYSANVAHMIGLDPAECERPEFAAVFSGNAPLPNGVRPYAQCYGGHQFGMVSPAALDSNMQATMSLSWSMHAPCRCQ